MRYVAGYKRRVDLKPGVRLDLRGSAVGQARWTAIIEAVTGGDGIPRLGRCLFERAVFTDVSFQGIVFEGDASFDEARFVKGASFYGARFLGNASFRSACFEGNASLHGAHFRRHASFDETLFRGDALFSEARCRADISFQAAWFGQAAVFDRAEFGRDAQFEDACFRATASWKKTRIGRHLLLDRVRFRADAWLGPLMAGGRISLDEARAARTLKLEACAAGGLGARRAVLRRAQLKLNATEAVLAFTSALELKVTGGRILDLVQVTVGQSTFTGSDLSGCRFAGAQLGELSLNSCAFAPALTEAPAAWQAGLYEEFVLATDDPCQARGFRYQAMQIRRTAEPRRAKRWLLDLLWVTCGYGLRAGRAIAWAGLIVLLVGAGLLLTQHSPHLEHARAHTLLH
jgi:uncharacterized protein YjbI with pentapeptide repeats